MYGIIFIILIVVAVVIIVGALRTSQPGDEYCQAEPDIRENQNENQNKEAEASEFWISSMLNIFAWVELVAGIILAFGSLVTMDMDIDMDVDAIINVAAFFGFLLGSLFSFLILKALAIFVKAANKYLNS